MAPLPTTASRPSGEARRPSATRASPGQSWSKRKRTASGTVPPVGDTVDLESATWTNSIGDPELIAVWKDPSFDARQRAFYYVRVLQIPTPRWSTYDAKKLGVAPPERVSPTVQERAWTSPIWYTPVASKAGAKEG